MSSFLDYWQNLWAGYPDWIAFSALAVIGLLALWLAAKLLLWCVKLLVIGTLVFVAVGCLLHFFA